MLRIADVLHRHGEDYLKRYGNAVLPSHVRAIQALTRCRTGAFGGHIAESSNCHCEHLFLHSCRNRACPQCGHDATSRWLARQRELLLPVTYFHVVVTLPAELRRLVRQHQRVLIPVLSQAAFESLSALCADPHWLGGQVGALAVLHTWTRTLEWHPHVHLLVPGGALAPDRQTWLRPPPRPKNYIVPHRALAKHFRGRFLALARRALPAVRFPEIPWSKRWVAFAKEAVQGPKRVLEYLGRYVHRTALTDKAILHCDDKTVTYAYRDSRDHHRKTMTLDAHEFLRRFLQHVPPRGLHRVRAFGLLHSSRRSTLRRLQLLLSRSTSPQAKPADAAPKNNPRVVPLSPLQDRYPSLGTNTLAIRMHRHFHCAPTLRRRPCARSTADGHSRHHHERSMKARYASNRAYSKASSRRLPVAPFFALQVLTTPTQHAVTHAEPECGIDPRRLIEDRTKDTGAQPIG